MIQIEKEDFFKLKQLDRIEYRQRRDDILYCNPRGTAIKMFNASITILAFVLLLAFSGGAWLGDEIGMKFLSILNPMAAIFGIVIYCSMIVDLIHFIKRKKKIKELNEEFFQIELKKPKDILSMSKKSIKKRSKK